MTHDYGTIAAENETLERIDDSSSTLKAFKNTLKHYIIYIMRSNILGKKNETCIGPVVKLPF